MRDIVAIEFDAEEYRSKQWQTWHLCDSNVPEYCRASQGYIDGAFIGQIVMERVSPALGNNQNGEKQTVKRTARNPLELVGG
jgi:hypothetical protein